MEKIETEVKKVSSLAVGSFAQRADGFAEISILVKHLIYPASNYTVLFTSSSYAVCPLSSLSILCTICLSV